MRHRPPAFLEFSRGGAVGLSLGIGLLVALSLGSLVADVGSAEPPAKPKYHLESLRGQVVWASDALADRFGVKVDADAAETCVALRTDTELFPIIKDFRGRGFHKDPRLRDRDMELRVRRYEGSPWLQLIKVYTLRPEGKYELDYWCDICAIPMYELKECECCQGPIRIRERRVAPVDDKSPPDDPEREQARNQ